ncbi:TolC family protein [Lutibacter sp.]
MKIYKYILFTLVLGLSQQSFAQEGKVNLDRYLVIAAENNPNLKTKFSEYMAAMEKIPQVGSLPDPQFAFGYFIQPVETRVGPQQYKFNIAQSFPWFGLLKAKKDVASEMANAKYELFENAKSNLFFEVKTAYYNYYFIEKAIEITKKNMDILGVFKRLSLVKIETGTASIVDELRVELELNDLENQLALFKDTRGVLQINLNNLLNREVIEPIIIPEILWQDKMPLGKQEMLNSIYTSNHEIKSIDYRLNAFINQEEVAKNLGMPSFNVGFGYTIVEKNSNSTAIDNGTDAILFPSIGIKIPLFRKKYKALIKEAKYLQEAETFKKENKKNVLSTIFSSSYKNFNDGDRRVALNLKQVQIAKKVLEVLITSYSTNAKDFEEVLRIERQLLKYELAYQQALVDKNAALAFMQYLIGK